MPTLGKFPCPLRSNPGWVLVAAHSIQVLSTPKKCGESTEDRPPLTGLCYRHERKTLMEVCRRASGIPATQGHRASRHPARPGGHPRGTFRLDAASRTEGILGLGSV